MNPFMDRQRLLVIGALLAPVLIVQGGRWLLGGSLSSASAMTALAEASPGPAPVITAARRVDVGDPQRRAWAYAQSVGERRANLDSPMEVIPAQTERAEPAPVARAPQIDTKPKPPRVVLSTVLKGARGTLAVINGTVYARGDEVAPGWIISVIDAEQLRVELLGPQNTRHVVERGR